MKVGVYEAEGELGRGGMGVVLRARSPRGEPVAVKLLTARGRIAPERFAREVRLLAALGHVDGFVPLVDSGESPHGPFLVMPLLTGGTLRDRIERGLAVDEAVALLVEVARALGRAHARGIIHRDLKPENVLFTAEGRPLVADLGLAKHFGDSAASGASVSFSRTGELAGTVGYMAPEQMKDAKSVGPAADVFALGAILFECLAGEPAFTGATGLEVMAKILAGAVPALARPDVPRPIADVVKRALARQPDARFADGEALALALEAAGTARPTSRRAPLAFAAVALAVGAIGGVAFIASRGGPPPRSAPPPTAAPPPPAPAVVVPRAKLRKTAVLGASAGCHDDIVWGVGATGRGEPVSVGQDGKLRVWDPETGRELSQLGPVGEPLQALALGSGVVAVTVGARGTIHRFAVGSGAQPEAIGKLDGSARAVAVSRDGTLLAAATEQGKLQVIDLATGASRSSTPAQAIGAVAFLPDGDLLVAGSPGLQRFKMDGAVPTASRLLLAPMQRRVAVSADGRLAAAIGVNDVLTVLDLASGETVMAPRPHAGQLTAVAFSKDGRWLATGSGDGRIALLRPTSEAIVALAQVHGSAVLDLAFTESGRIISGGFDRVVRLHEVVEAGALRSSWAFPRHGGQAFAVARAPNGQLLTGGMDAAIRVWDSPGAKTPRLLAGHRWAIRSIAITPDGRLVGSSAHDRTARLWRFVDGAPLHELTGLHFNNVLCAVFTPDGRRFLSAGDDPKIVVWDTTDGHPIREMKGPEHGPLHWCGALAMRPDGRRLLSGAANGWVQEWEIETGEEVGRFQPHAKEGRLPLALDARGTRLVTGSDDKTARVWDVERAISAATRSLARLEVGVEIERVAFAGGPDRVLCADVVGTLSLWDVASARRLDEAKLGAPLRSLDVAPDGRTAWVGDELGFVHELAVDDR